MKHGIDRRSFLGGVVGAAAAFAGLRVAAGEACAAVGAASTGGVAAPAAMPEFRAAWVAVDAALAPAAAAGTSSLRRELRRRLIVGTDAERSLVIAWTRLGPYASVGDVLVDALAHAGEPRRQAAAILAALSTPAVTAAAHGAAIVRAHAVETDPDIKLDLGELRARLGV